MGSQVEASLAMNQPMYCNRPKNPLISFSLLGGGISNMVLFFDGSTPIRLSLTKKPNNVPMVNPKVHFCGFNLSLYSLILSKNFLKLIMWPSLSLGFIIISSIYTSTSLCIISCNKRCGHSLVSRTRFLEPKWHHGVTINSPFCGEGSFCHIPMSHLGLVIP